MEFQYQPRSVAGICIHGNTLFIAKRNSGGAMGERWEFPGGKVEPPESDQEALIREYEEEFGVPITVGPCIASAVFEHHHQTRYLYAYLVEFREQQFVMTEHTQWRWATLDEIEKLPFADSDKKLLTDLYKFVRK